MKTKNWMRTAIFAVLAVAATACTDNDLIDKDVNHTPDITDGKMTIHAATGDEAANTRVAYEDASGTLTWQKGDYLTVALMKDGKVVKQETDFLFDGEDGDRSGNFTGTAIEMVEGGTWSIYYPNKVTVDTNNGTATLPMTGQMQTGNNNTEHLRNYILLEATGINDLSKGCNLRMQSSIMKFELKDVPAGVGELKNLVWMLETDKGTRSMTLRFTPGTVKFDGTNTSLTAFLSFMPQDMKPKTDGKFTVILTGDKTYVAEGKVNTSYAAGTRYTAKLGEGIMLWEEKAIMALTVKVDKANGLGFNIPFPESGNVLAKLTVDWGDDSGLTEVASGTALIAGDGLFNHTYRAAGKYTITITSDEKDETNQQIPDFNFQNNRPNYGFNGRKLISIDTPLLNTEAKNFSNCFNGCSTLQSIPSGLFDKNTKATNFSNCFYGCSALQSIPSGLFVKNTAALDFLNCFSDCYALQSIPSGLFDNTAATNFSNCFSGCYTLQSIPSGLFDNTAAADFSNCFSYCSALKSIPSGLFGNNTNAINFSNCFSYCSALKSIPSGLFGNNTNATNFSSCFSYCSALQSIPSGLFDNTAATDFSNCFSGCSELRSIPSGLFDNTAATDFSNCFSGCSELRSIPSGLFGNMAAIDFSYCFSDCSELKIIPNGLFDNTAATNFSNCFSECTALQSIPNELFDKNTMATNFSFCFSGCTALLNIPKGLFDNTAATDFSGCFQECYALEEIPPGLFDKNTQITSFASCFRECHALKEIPLGLFNNNTLVTTFGNCFQGCSALKEIPKGLFDKNTAATNFASCFENCSELESIPEGLFDNNKQATNFNYCFSGCTHLVLNSNIFSTKGDINRFSGKTMLFASCFQKVGSELEKDKGGTAPNLWDYIGVTWGTIGDCFTDATNLENYPIIPNNWKGL